MPKSARIVTAVVVLGLAGVLAGCASGSGAAPAAASSSSGAGSSGAGSADQAVVTAVGTGMVTGVPDTLTVMLSVETSASSASAALSANDQRTTALIALLKRRGATDADLQTTNLSIDPTYDNSGQHITGYQVSDQVQTTWHDLKTAGSLIDAAAAAVGSGIRVDQVSLSIADDSSLRAAARVAAVKQASAQAAQMAGAAGVKLGKLHSITDEEVTTPSPQTFDSLAAGVAAEQTPVEAGSQQLSVQVQVVYDINQ